MPGASQEVALERAESLRQGVKEMHLYQRGLKPVTISLGVAVFPAHGDTALQLVRSADAALYLAKQEGQDRVILFADNQKTSLADQPASPFHDLKAG